MTPEQTAIWRRMPEDARQRVMAAPLEYRAPLVELWESVRQNGDGGAAQAQRDQADQDAAILGLIARAAEDAWPDGRKRTQLQRVMQARLRRLEQAGFANPDDASQRDPALARRFLDGCVRALRRDGAIASGALSRGELAALKEREVSRAHAAQWADAADDWEQQEARYGS